VSLSNTSFDSYEITFGPVEGGSYRANRTRLLVVALMLLGYAPARALEVPSITPSPTQQKNAIPLIPKSTPDDEGKGFLDSMKLLAPGIGWAQRSSDELHKTIYWTTDNGAHWRNITPPLTGKSNLAALFFLDTIAAGRCHR
jgi:hypothetical protein